MAEWTRDELKKEELEKAQELSESVNGINWQYCICFPSVIHFPFNPGLSHVTFWGFQWDSSNLTHSGSVKAFKKCEFLLPLWDSCYYPENLSKLAFWKDMRGTWRKPKLQNQGLLDRLAPSKSAIWPQLHKKAHWVQSSLAQITETTQLICRLLLF